MDRREQQRLEMLGNATSGSGWPEAMHSIGANVGQSIGLEQGRQGWWNVLRGVNAAQGRTQEASLQLGKSAGKLRATTRQRHDRFAQADDLLGGGASQGDRPHSQMGKGHKVLLPQPELMAALLKALERL
jgi:hypothetical protein